MKLLSKKEQHEIMKLLSDIMIYTSGTKAFEVAYDNCTAISRILNSKTGEFELKNMRIEKEIAKQRSDFNR